MYLGEMKPEMGVFSFTSLGIPLELYSDFSFLVVCPDSLDENVISGRQD